MVSNSKQTKARGEVVFKRKQDQAREGTKAWAEYKAQRSGVDEKIAHPNKKRVERARRSHHPS